jgi:hypothetical protein
MFFQRVKTEEMYALKAFLNMLLKSFKRYETFRVSQQHIQKPLYLDFPPQGETNIINFFFKNEYAIFKLFTETTANLNLKHYLNLDDWWKLAPVGLDGKPIKEIPLSKSIFVKGLFNQSLDSKDSFFPGYFFSKPFLHLWSETETLDIGNVRALYDRSNDFNDYQLEHLDELENIDEKKVKKFLIDYLNYPSLEDYENIVKNLPIAEKKKLKLTKITKKVDFVNRINYQYHFPLFFQKNHGDYLYIGKAFFPFIKRITLLALNRLAILESENSIKEAFNETYKYTNIPPSKLINKVGDYYKPLVSFWYENDPRFDIRIKPGNPDLFLFYKYLFGLNFNEQAFDKFFKDVFSLQGKNFESYVKTLPPKPNVQSFPKLVILRPDTEFNFNRERKVNEKINLLLNYWKEENNFFSINFLIKELEDLLINIVRRERSSLNLASCLNLPSRLELTKEQYINYLFDMLQLATYSESESFTEVVTDPLFEKESYKRYSTLIPLLITQICERLTFSENIKLYNILYDARYGIYRFFIPIKKGGVCKDDLLRSIHYYDSNDIREMVITKEIKVFDWFGRERPNIAFFGKRYGDTLFDTIVDELLYEYWGTVKCSSDFDLQELKTHIHRCANFVDYFWRYKPNFTAYVNTYEDYLLEQKLNEKGFNNNPFIVIFNDSDDFSFNFEDLTHKYLDYDLRNLLNKKLYAEKVTFKTRWNQFLLEIYNNFSFSYNEDNFDDTTKFFFKENASFFDNYMRFDFTNDFITGAENYLSVFYQCTLKELGCNFDMIRYFCSEIIYKEIKVKHEVNHAVFFMIDKFNIPDISLKIFKVCFNYKSENFLIYTYKNFKFFCKFSYNFFCHNDNNDLNFNNSLSNIYNFISKNQVFIFKKINFLSDINSFIFNFFDKIGNFIKWKQVSKICIKPFEDEKKNIITIICNAILRNEILNQKEGTFLYKYYFNNNNYFEYFDYFGIVDNFIFDVFNLFRNKVNDISSKILNSNFVKAEFDKYSNTGRSFFYPLSFINNIYNKLNLEFIVKFFGLCNEFYKCSTFIHANILIFHSLTNLNMFYTILKILSVDRFFMENFSLRDPIENFIEFLVYCIKGNPYHFYYQADADSMSLLQTRHITTPKVISDYLYSYIFEDFIINNKDNLLYLKNFLNDQYFYKDIYHLSNWLNSTYLNIVTLNGTNYAHVPTIDKLITYASKYNIQVNTINNFINIFIYVPITLLGKNFFKGTIIKPPIIAFEEAFVDIGGMKILIDCVVFVPKLLFIKSVLNPSKLLVLKLLLDQQYLDSNNVFFINNYSFSKSFKYLWSEVKKVETINVVEFSRNSTINVVEFTRKFSYSIIKSFKQLWSETEMIKTSKYYCINSKYFDDFYNFSDRFSFKYFVRDIFGVILNDGLFVMEHQILDPINNKSSPFAYRLSISVNMWIPSFIYKEFIGYFGEYAFLKPQISPYLYEKLGIQTTLTFPKYLRLIAFEIYKMFDPLYVQEQTLLLDYSLNSFTIDKKRYKF